MAVIRRVQSHCALSLPRMKGLHLLQVVEKDFMERLSLIWFLTDVQIRVGEDM